MRLARARAAFTLAEVLVAVALVAVLASVTIPTIRGRLREGEEDAIVQEFDDLSSAIIAYQQNVGKYPPSLDYLMALPSSGATDFCGNNLTTTQKNNWRGPYISRTINGGTYVIGQQDTVEDIIASSTVTSFNGGSQNAIALLIDGPDQTSANNVDLKVDGVADPVNGTLTWQTRGSGTRLFFNIPIRNGAC